MLIRPLAIDYGALRLSAEEGFVLSRIDGPMSLRDVVALTGFEEDRIVEILRRLSDQGAIEVPRESRIPSIVIPRANGVVVEFAAATDVGMVREGNEDCLAICDLSTGSAVGATPLINVTSGQPGLLFIVSDGMGGAKAGEVASTLVVEGMIEHLLEFPVDPERAAESLASSVLEGNRRVIAGAIADPDCSGMGATVIALLMHGDTAYTAEIGDSRVYLFRDGVMSLMSKDQTQAQMLIDSGLMDEESIKLSRTRSVLLQSIGQSGDLLVAQHAVKVRDGDKFVLCSDGLTTHVSDGEIAAALILPADQACSWLVDRAKELGGKDNISVIVVDVKDAVAPVSSRVSPRDSLTTIRAFVLGEPPQ